MTGLASIAALALSAALLTTSNASAAPAGPASPVPVTSFIGDGSVELDWADVATARSYETRVRASGTPTWQRVETSVDSSIIVSGLVNGTKYWLQLRSVSPGGSGDWGTQFAVIPNIVPPNVGDLSVTGEDTALLLGWLEPTDTSGSTIDHLEIRYRLSGSTTWQPSTSTPVSSRSATLDGLVNKSKYWVSVRTVGTAGAASAWSAQRSATPSVAPPAAPELTTSTLNGAVVLDWSEPSGHNPLASQYEIRYRASGSTTWISVPSTSSRSASVSGLTNGLRYWFQVRSVSVESDGLWSAQEFAQPSLVPLAVTSFTRSLTRGAIALSWAVPAASPGTVNLFEVEWRPVGDTAWAGTASISTNSTTIPSLDPAITYEVRVRAHNAAGWGAWASTTARPAVVPSAPTGVTPRILADPTKIGVYWAPGFDTGGGTVIRYESRYRAEGSGVFSAISTAAATSSFVQFASVPTGKNYLFQVRAVSDVGTGAWSSQIALLYPTFSSAVMNITTTDFTPIVDKELYLPGTAQITPNGTSVPAYSGSLTIKGHGNTTWGALKKPYRIKLDTKAPLGGMASNKNWVLLANYLDRSLIRNDVSTYLGAQTGLAWTPKSVSTEVVLNGKYLGLYTLIQQVRVDSDRVNIKAMDPTDISGTKVTGGYLLEQDARLDTTVEAGFKTSRNVKVAIKDPEPVGPEQTAYISGYYQQFEDALFSDSFADPTTGYANYIDVDSWIDWYLVEELTSNHDAYYSSIYMYKPRSGKLFMGPLWDFDLSLGNPGAPHALPAQGWWVKTGHRYFARLFEDPAFAAKVADRWQQLSPGFSTALQFIDTRKSQLTASVANDKLRWKYAPDPITEMDSVKSWLTTRLAWMDAQFAD